MPFPSGRENDAGRTRTATSDSPPHCRSSLAYSRSSNATIRSRSKQYRRSTLENPGRLDRLRWRPFQDRVGAHVYFQQHRETPCPRSSLIRRRPRRSGSVPSVKSSCAPGQSRSWMARSRLSSLVRHAEQKQRKARCYPINKSTQARELVTPSGDNSGHRVRLTGWLFVEVVNSIQTALPWGS